MSVSDGVDASAVALTAATTELPISPVTKGKLQCLPSDGARRDALGSNSPSANEGGVRGRTAGVSLSRSVVDDEFVEHAESAEDEVSLKSFTVTSLRSSLCVDEGARCGDSMGGRLVMSRGCGSLTALNAGSVTSPSGANMNDNGDSRKGPGSARRDTSSALRNATLVRWRH